MGDRPLKTYAECVADIEAARPEWTRAQVAHVLGIHESVLSRRLNGTKATHEATVVANTVRDIICGSKLLRKKWAHMLDPKSFYRVAIDAATR